MGKTRYKTIPLDGKMVTAVDPLLLNGSDFSVLDNFRYVNVGVNGIRPLGGMTKINTNALTNARIRSGIHFKKDYPVAESHVLVQSLNAGLTDSTIYDNTTAIPNAGDFSATAIASSLGANTGRFNLLPDGCVGFFNRNKAYVWSGAEARIGAFIHSDPAGTFLYDYTDQMNNMLTDSANIAYLKSVASTPDANTKALYHLDNAVTDASGNSHTLTNTYVTFTTTNAPYGTHWADFNGSSAYLSVADHADFYLPTEFTFEVTVNVDTAQENPLYFQKTGSDDNNFIYIYLDASNRINIQKSASGVATTRTSTSSITTGVTAKLRVTYNGTNAYFFIDGVVCGGGGLGAAPADYTGTVMIGRADLATDKWFDGKMDEIRISNSCRSTDSYTVETVPFFPVVCTVYIGNPRPIKGVKWYVNKANTNVGATSAYYTDSTGAFVTVGTVTDGTKTGSVPLAVTGSTTFTDTVSLAYPSVLFGVMQYWYRFEFTNLVNTVGNYPEIKYTTIDSSMQTFKDIWDGIPLPISQFWDYVNPSAGGNYKYKDYIGPVQKQDVTQAYNGYNFANAPFQFYDGGRLYDSSDYAYVGTETRATGVRIVIAPDDKTGSPGPSYVNTKATVLTLEYWNGSAWTALTGVVDNTKDSGGTKALSVSGTIIWTPPADGLEFKTTIGNNSIYQYYYRFSYSNGLSTNCGIDEITYIPVPVTINAMGYGFEWRNRTILLDDINGRRDRIMISSEGSTGTFNGEDSFDGNLGDGFQLIAGGSLYHHSSEGIYVYGVICSKSRTHVITGNGPGDLKILPISEKYGCVAPNTFEVCIVRASDKEVKNVAIWRSATGMVACDGTSVYPISDDIADLYDPHKTTVITSSAIGEEYGRFDGQYGCYHYFHTSSSGTTISKEKLYDPKKDGWSSAVRTPVLMGIIPVSDTYGNQYSYGFTDTGFLERLEYGNTFDTNAIIYKVRTADAPIVSDNELGLIYRSRMDVIRILCGANASADAVTLKYYGDTILTPLTLDQTVSQVSTTNRVTISAPVSFKETAMKRTHSFELNATMDDISTGFNPYALVVGYTMADFPDTGT